MRIPIAVVLILSYMFNVEGFIFKPYGKFISNFSGIQRMMTNNQWANFFEDEEECLDFLQISKNYLVNKFQACVDDDCKFLRSPKEACQLLREVLPPLTQIEMEKEIQRVFTEISQRTGSSIAPNSETENVAVEDFVNSVNNNPYWIKAGPRVVQELIYLDCVYHNYYKKQQLLDNDDYDQLKSTLTWEGSIAASVTSKEALFISSVAAFRRGQELLSDKQYKELKDELLRQDSWVVQRMPDPLEKLGLDTFMSYLHRSL